MPTTYRIPSPPRGGKIFKWLGPGFLWMVSAAGSGELLFTPRVGAMYGYALLWALFAAVILKFFINREIGRFAVCTGSSVVTGFATLPGPRNWALWVILVPQLFVAVISVAGLAGGAATALTLFLPGNIAIWMIVSLLSASTLVLWGKYKGVEKASVILASVLAVTSIVAAISVSPSLSELVKGLKPTIPAETKVEEILPWLGFMMSGAAGLMWYSYWIPAKGYGMAGSERDNNYNKHSSIESSDKKSEGNNDNRNADASNIPDIKQLSNEDQKKLKGWIKVMTLDTTTAVIGTVVITIAFLILGTELLKPKGLIPEENKVAETLGSILGSIWGPIGFWFMVVGVFIGFWDTILSDQDGHSRLFANGTRKLLGPNLKGRWKAEKFLKNFFTVVLVTIFPLALYLIMGDPVALLKLAGAIEAAHIPFVAGLTLYLNRKTLPRELQPSTIVFIITIIAALFFAAFAVFYLLQLMGVVTV